MSEVDPALAAHYRHDLERERLTTSARLEGVRTRELLERFLPRSPAVVLDVGGACGAYALPLAQAGPGHGSGRRWLKLTLLNPEAIDAQTRSVVARIATATRAPRLPPAAVFGECSVTLGCAQRRPGVLAAGRLR